MHDTDPMPFGKYKGRRMQDVPSGYLDWLLGQDWIDEWPAVKAYIDENYESIQREIAEDN